MRMVCGMKELRLGRSACRAISTLGGKSASHQLRQIRIKAKQSSSAVVPAVSAPRLSRSFATLQKNGTIAEDNNNKLFNANRYRHTRKDLDDALSLPRECFTSPEWHAAEVESVLAPSWVCVGRADELAAAGRKKKSTQGKGSYLAIDLPSGPAIVVTGKDGITRAFSNVCTHRGAKLVEDGMGTLKGGITCPYHAWTYDPTSGSLVGVRKGKDMMPCFVKQDHPLQQLPLENYRGFLFVDGSGEAPPLQECLGNIHEVLKEWPLEDMVTVGRREYTVDCNWKFLVENTSETYHTSVVHNASLGDMPSQPVGEALGIDVSGDWEGIYVPGERSIVPLADDDNPFPEFTDKSFFLTIFPTLQVNVTRDCAWWMRMLPVGPEQTRVTLGFLFPKSTTEMPDFDELVKPYFHRWHVAVTEDNGISLNQQQGARALFGPRPGPYHSLEFAVHRFDNYILDRVLGDRVGAVKTNRSVEAAPMATASSRRQNQQSLFGPGGGQQQPPPQQQQQRSFSSTAAPKTQRFVEKLAVVTGAGRDIGAAIAKRLASEGAAVVVHYNESASGAEAVVSDIRNNMGGNAIAVQADLSSPQGAQALVDAAVKLRQDMTLSSTQTSTSTAIIDVLVHNTGGMVARTPLPELDLPFMHKVMDLNFTSLVFAVQACVPLMPAGSSIVTLSSQAARDGGGPGAGIYAAAKGAVHTYTRSLAKELGGSGNDSGHGIRVNTVSPGMIDTTFHDVFSKPQVRTNVAGMTQLKREGKAEEVASVVAFLASSDASYVTGVAMDINGGLAFSA